MMTTPSTPLTLDGLKNRVTEAASFVVGAEDASQYIWDRLQKLGIYQDELSCELLASQDCTEGDARRAFCENGEPNQPVPRFRRIWRMLKGRDDTDTKMKPPSSDMSAIDRLVETLKPIGQFSDKELIDAYGADCAYEIVKELNSRAKGRPFVAFTDVKNGIVEPELTLRMLREARRREMPVHYSVKDCLYELFKAGDFPGDTFMECPFHKGNLLLGGYCDECGHTWEGIDYEVMQFARLLQDRREAPKDPFNRKQFINNARQGMESVKKDYPKATIMFEQLAEETTLPVLKKRRNTAKGTKGTGNWNTKINIHD